MSPKIGNIGVSSAVNTEYFVTIDGEKRGPFCAAELRQKIEQGAFPRDSRYWREGWMTPRRLDELSAEERCELLGTANEIAKSAEASTRARRWCLVGAVTVALTGAGCVIAVLHRLDQAERRAEARQTELRHELAETVRAARQDSESRVERMRQLMEESAQAEKQLLQRQAMDHDARMLAAAAQHYFLESCQTEVAFGYDPRTGALSGPVTQYLRRIAPGYTARRNNSESREPSRSCTPTPVPPKNTTKMVARPRRRNAPVYHRLNTCSSQTT